VPPLQIALPHIVPTATSSSPSAALTSVYTDSGSLKPHSLLHASRLTPHTSTSHFTFSNKTRPSRQQIADGPKVLVGTPSKTLPLTRPATSCLLVTRSWTFSKLVFGRLYHRDPEWVVAAAGAEGSSRGSTGAGAGPRSTEASSQPSQPSQAQPGPTTICWAPSLLRGGTTGGPPGRGAGMTPRAWWDRGIRGTRARARAKERARVSE